MSTLAHSAGLALIVRPVQMEASLWRRLRFENEANCREHLFNRYLALARMIARAEFRRRPAYGLEKADFEQLAFGGLLEAIDRFDPLRRVPFEHFAKHRIRGTIADGLARSSESGAQYSFRRRAEIERMRSLQEGAESKPGDYIGELADLAAGLAVGFIAESAQHALASNAAPGDLNAYESRGWRDLQLSVLQEIERLQHPERLVLQQHYINGVPFTDIARLLGVSKGRVSQLHRAAVKKVRDRLQRFD